MGFEVGVAEGVGEAFLLCCVDGVEFPYALRALAAHHAFCVDAACVVQIALMRHAIAAEGGGELREVLSELIAAIGACADVYRAYPCVASDIARVRLRGELTLGAESS